MQLMSSLFSAAVALAALTLGACVDGAPAEAELADGLTLEISRDNRVAGTFQREGLAIRFDLDRRGDGNRAARLATADGAPLLTAELARGIESVSFLDGRGQVSGPVGGAWTTQAGEADVFDAVNATPEFALVPYLKEALLDRGIDAGLVTHDGRSPADPQWWDGYYDHLAYGQTMGFSSWAFYNATTVVIAREEAPDTGYAAAWFQAGFAPNEYVSGHGFQYHRRYWWGAWVTVGNNLLPLCSVDGTWCQNTTLITRHY